MKPPPRTKQLRETYIGECTIGQLSIPLILDLFNLSCTVDEDVDDRRDGLLLADTLDNVACLEVKNDWVACILDFVMETLDFAKGGL